MTTSTDSISVQAAKEHPLPEYTAGQSIGPYEVIERLGEGMLGAVYKVKHPVEGEVLALKILRPKLVAEEIDADRFNHELQGTKQINDRGVVKILDTGEFDGTVYYTMEFVDGCSLRDVMNDYRSRGEDIPHGLTHRIISEILRILTSSHAVGLHRDLRPENILFEAEVVRPGGELPLLRLGDYGVARVISPTIFADAQLNREGAWYLAPEMSEFRDQAAGPNSDLYSVGAIYYEMLVGVPPTGRYEMPSVLTGGEVSGKIDDLIEIALAPNPQDRFQTAEYMLNQMQETYSDLYSGGTASFKTALISLAVLAAIVAGLALYFKQAEPTPEERKAEEMDRRAVIKARVRAIYDSPQPAPEVSDAKYNDMLWIPGGEFIRGAWDAYDSGLAGEKPERPTEVGGFWMNKHALHHRVMKIPEDADDQRRADIEARNDELGGRPFRDITFNEAQRLCADRRKRLCSEKEWEKACKGPDTFLYAYGDTFETDACPPSGWFPPYYTILDYDKSDGFLNCVSGFGVVGLSGGILEWTKTKRGDKLVVKGGSIGNESMGTRCAGRDGRAANFFHESIGVRCCAD
jgi:serine/threonine protein kinase